MVGEKHLGTVDFRLTFRRLGTYEKAGAIKVDGAGMGRCRLHHSPLEREDEEFALLGGEVDRDVGRLPVDAVEAAMAIHGNLLSTSAEISLPAPHLLTSRSQELRCTH